MVCDVEFSNSDDPFSSSTLGTITLTTSDVDASCTLALTSSDALTSVVEGKASQLLPPFPLPGGIDIAGVFVLGPTFVLDADVDITSVTAVTTLSFGVDVSIPDDS